MLNIPLNECLEYFERFELNIVSKIEVWPQGSPQKYNLSKKLSHFERSWQRKNYSGRFMPFWTLSLIELLRKFFDFLWLRSKSNFQSILFQSVFTHALL